MPIIVPTVMLLIVAVASIAVAANVAWRHYRGTSVEASFRSYTELPVPSTPSRVDQLAA